MKRFLVILILFGCNHAFSQKISYSLQAGANYPVISEVVHKSPAPQIMDPTTGFTIQTINIGAKREVYNANAGFFVSGKMNRTIRKRFFITSGLSFEYRRYNRSTIVETNDMRLTPSEPITINPAIGQPYGIIQGSVEIRDSNGVLLNPDPKPVYFYTPSDKLGDTEVFQIEMPVLAGVHFFKEKLMLQVGLNAGYVIRATEYKQTYSFRYSNSNIETTKADNSEAFNRLSFGLSFSTCYRFTKSFGIQISALRNLSPIYSDDADLAGNAYLNSFSAGVNYFIKN